LRREKRRSGFSERNLTLNQARSGVIGSLEGTLSPIEFDLKKFGFQMGVFCANRVQMKYDSQLFEVNNISARVE
jgi:hypothetical protein